MAGTPNSIITPQSPGYYVGDLTGGTAATGGTAVTSRAPLSVSTTLSPLCGTSANGRQIISLEVHAASSDINASTTAGIVFIWEYNGSKYYVVKEIEVSSINPSITIPGFSSKITYSDWIIPSTHSLWVSTTVPTTTSTNAFVVLLVTGEL